MIHKKYLTRLLALTLGASLFMIQTAWAETIVPPMPFAVGGIQTPISDAAADSPGAVSAESPEDSMVSGPGVEASAETTAETAADANTSSVTDAPSGTASALTEPEISADGAVLMDGATGKILYGKNEDTQYYPASITKVMTALLVLEHCSLDDTVTFSASATSNLESGAVSLNITEGDQLTVEQALYGLLLKSANEIANGLAEHVSGSVSSFAELMNAKAKSLGCKNTNFVNPNGLNDSSHKTTAYDMALILREAVKNETFRKIDTTLTYNFPATKNAAARTITMGHKMMYPSDARYYEGIIGGKTGYTSLARNTLVTAAERDGVQLIAVILHSQSTQYTDTKALLDYGFENYAALMGQENAGGTATVITANTAEASNTVTATNTAETANTTAAADTTEGVWYAEGQRWYYIKGDGSRASGEWLKLDGHTYWFDSDGYMATGWRQFTNGSWYYFSTTAGYMATECWIEDGGDWFYLGSDGVLLTDTTMPDGYTVDENGILKQ